MNEFESSSGDGNCDGDGGAALITAAVAAEDSSIISYRPIRESDYDAIKALHLELYPIEYQESYYSSAVQSVGFLGKPMRTVVAEVASTGKLVGFIFYQFIDYEESEEQSLFFAGFAPTEVCYILVFGLDRRYRRMGIGTALMNFCKADCENNINCGCCYLHVIEYNKVAMEFYKASNFAFLRNNDQFYSINGKEYSASIFALYYHGYSAPIYLSVGNFFKNLSVDLFFGLAQIVAYTTGNEVEQGGGGGKEKDVGGECSNSIEPAIPPGGVIKSSCETNNSSIGNNIKSISINSSINGSNSSVINDSKS